MEFIFSKVSAWLATNSARSSNSGPRPATGYTYVTRKNRRNNPDRLTLRKYDPAGGRHVDFREER